MNALPSPPSSRGSLELPCKFGRYTLFEVIGKGGMAEIFLARVETELGATRLAVVKRILPAFAGDPRFAAMLTHEAKLAARLNHKHIVNVIDLGRADGDSLFIAMEYVEGFDLNALLRRCTEDHVGLPVQHAFAIVSDVLAGLDYAHRLRGEDDAPLGIVHRDVSPSNVLVSYDGEVKLCDFGIAHANDLVREDANEALKGKAGYMSPEHARGGAVDARSDVFAAGIILWELLAGRRLYKPKGGTSLIEQARAAEIPPLPAESLPQADKIATIVAKALAVDPAERYASASAMLRDLEAYLGETELRASRLKLGEWMTQSFGTGLVEQRRASERRLPKSAPPPRSSDRVRDSAALLAAPASSKQEIAPAPAGPVSDASPAPPNLEPNLEPNVPSDVEPAATPESLAGASLDVGPTSSAALPSVPESSTPEPATHGRRAKALSTPTIVLLAIVVLGLVALVRHFMP